MDVPDSRSTHTVPTPLLGGIGIYLACLFTLLLCTPRFLYGDLKAFCVASLIICLLGIRDDFRPMSPFYKILGQLCAITSLLFLSPESMQLFDILNGSNTVILLCIYFIGLFLINAFNFIDGINGLSSVIGILTSLIFGFCFIQMGSVPLSILSFALAGALVSFLRFNWGRASIFMGDTGSMLIGFISAFFVWQLINSNIKILTLGDKIIPILPLIIALLILPISDTIRVFFLRLSQGISPFKADKRHIHHMLLELGYSHPQAAFILLVINILFVGIVFILSNLNVVILIFILLLTSLLFMTMLHLLQLILKK